MYDKKELIKQLTFLENELESTTEPKLVKDIEKQISYVQDQLIELWKGRPRTSQEMAMIQLLEEALKRLRQVGGYIQEDDTCRDLFTTTPGYPFGGRLEGFTLAMDQFVTNMKKRFVR